MQDGVVDVGADVGEPELQRREVVRGPHVPVEVRGVGDHPGVDHPVDDLLEPLGAAQVLGRPGDRPPSTTTGSGSCRSRCRPRRGTASCRSSPGAPTDTAGRGPSRRRRSPGRGRRRARGSRRCPAGGQARPAVDHRLVPRRGRDDLLLPAVERMGRRRQDARRRPLPPRRPRRPGGDDLGAARSASQMPLTVSSWVVMISACSRGPISCATRRRRSGLGSARR